MKMKPVSNTHNFYGKEDLITVFLYLQMAKPVVSMHSIIADI